MSPAPFEVPIKASEAAVLADITFQLLDNRQLQEAQRNRLAARAAGLGLSSVRPYWGSLQQDPVHASSFYLAVDAISKGPPVPLLLHMALASAPASGLFPKAMLIGRMRPGGGREVVVNAASFGPGDTVAIDTFATKVDRAFLPRPLASTPVLSILSNAPEEELPAAFDGFRQLRGTAGINAAFIASPGLTARTLAAAVWSAIRAGWREGYGLEACPEEVDQSAAFTRFRSFVYDDGAERAAGAPEAEVEEFGRRFTLGESVYEFAPAETSLLQRRFGAWLAAAGKLYDTVRNARVAAGFGRAFDFEIVLPSTANARATFFCLYWLKSHGRPVTLVAPPLASVDDARQHSLIARHFGSTLSFDEETLSRLPHPLQWTGGRWNCRLEGKITAARIQAVAAALRT